MVESRIRRLINVGKMEDSSITRGRRRPKTTITETIKKDLKISELDRDMIYDKTLWCRLIHVAGPTLCDKAWSLLY